MAKRAFKTASCDYKLIKEHNYKQRKKGCLKIHTKQKWVWVSSVSDQLGDLGR